MILCVVTYERNDEEIPIIIIVHDEEIEEELSRLAQFPAQIKHSDEFVLIVMDGIHRYVLASLIFPRIWHITSVLFRVYQLR